MVVDELIGKEVIGTKHDVIGVRIDERIEVVEITGVGPFPDEDLQSGVKFFMRFMERRSFVVGGDTGLDISLERISGKEGSVSVNG